MLLDHLQANSGWILIQKGCDKAGPLQVDVHLESPPKEHLEAETTLKLLVLFPLFNLWMPLLGFIFLK